ncbi:MAG TPA: efflux RND transporter periplasmic adaptor subunit [Spirochaetota bacterium]|nr:efflux RND transporter periplasmic adaptor subunit [Spirochaetota bacterium]
MKRGVRMLRGDKKNGSFISGTADTDAGSWWRTPRARFAGTGLAIASVIGFFIWLFIFHPYVSTDDARIDADVIRVANQGASQRIDKVSVEEGSRVTRGTLLVELDHRTAEAQRDRAAARAHLTASDLRRAPALAEESGMSRQQLDRIRADAQAAEADLRLAEIALENTYLKSPVDGIVVQKLAKQGNILEANQPAVTIVDIDHAWVSANVEETEVSLVKPGQRVSISVDEGGNLSGKVAEVRKAAAAQFALIPSDNAAGNFTKLVQRIPIKIILDPHPDRVLRVGQSVVIKIRVR